MAQYRTIHTKLTDKEYLQFVMACKVNKQAAVDVVTELCRDFIKAHEKKIIQHYQSLLRQTEETSD